MGACGAERGCGSGERPRNWSLPSNRNLCALPNDSLLKLLITPKGPEARREKSKMNPHLKIQIANSRQYPFRLDAEPPRPSFSVFSLFICGKSTFNYSCLSPVTQKNSKQEMDFHNDITQRQVVPASRCEQNVQQRHGSRSTAAYSSHSAFLLMLRRLEMHEETSAR